MKKAFYSIVQYCPDRFRAEVVNVGLVLLCPETKKIRVQMTNDFRRARRFFRKTNAGIDHLKLSLDSMKNRIDNSNADLNTYIGLMVFAGTRANDLHMTEPRLIKVKNLDADFDSLYDQLVE